MNLIDSTRWFATGAASVLLCALAATPCAADEDTAGPSDTSAYQLIQLLNQNEALSAEIFRLRGQIEELMRNSDRARESQQKIATDFDTRISTIEARPETDTSEDKARIAALESRQLQLEQALTAMHEVVTAATMEPVQKSTPETIYESALEKYRAGDYENAALDFQAFLQLYSGDSSAASARYWLSEALLRQGKFESAIESGQNLLLEHPDSDKAPETMFLIGKAHLEMGDAGGARSAWEDLVFSHPDSTPAGKARELLQRLP